MPTENRSSAEARAVHLTQDREMRVYIAGPMTGLPDFNFPAFNAAAAMMRSAGWHVENPAEHGHVEGAEWADYLRYDIARLATCEMIMLLPGWSNSKGANLEVSIAQQLGMPIKLAEGAEAAQQHQGEPVALPARKPEPTELSDVFVDAGNEGWNACLDEIAKLGPLYTRPVQGEPVLWRYRKTPARSWFYTAHKRSAEIALLDGYIVEEFYTHADPGEVERLREGISKHWKVVCDQRAELDTLRAQLREQDALLHKVRKTAKGMREDSYDSDDTCEVVIQRSDLQELEAILSASAEPSAPVEMETSRLSG